MPRVLAIFISLVTFSTAFGYTFDAERLGKNADERLAAREIQSKKILSVMNEQSDLDEVKSGRSVQYVSYNSQMTADMNTQITMTRQVLSASTLNSYFCDYQISIPKRLKVDVALIKCSEGIKPRPLNN